MQIFSLHWMMQNIRLFNVCEASQTFKSLMFCIIQCKLKICISILNYFAWFIVDLRFLLEFFLRKSFRNTIRVSNSLDPDHADSWSAGSRLLIKVISRQQKLPLMRKTGNFKND